MSLNTLQTAYTNGQIIDASHINELTLSLLGDFVGRDSNGIPTPSQNLGTLAIPWGSIYGTGLILNGLAVDTNQIVTVPNRVISGQTRTLSSLPDFLRADGAALEFDILGLTTNLLLSINNTATTVNTNITKTGFTAAPSTNNTCDVNDTTIVNDLFAGEIDSAIPEITIDAVGTEISTRIGQLAAFETPTGEIFIGLIKSATKITNVYRGFYLDSSGAPIVRGNLSNNDTLTLLSLGWVFVEDNGTTVDVSYKTPIVSYTSPGSPATGDYWYDLSNQVWKRYSGASFDIINRILVGQVVANETETIATRSHDFSNLFAADNNIEVELDTTEIITSKDNKAFVNVYGTKVAIENSKLSWNITTDLETGLTEAVSTLYYLYLSENGRRVISDKKPHLRNDLVGHYHPSHSYRCVGMAYNNSSSNFTLFDDTAFNKNAPSKYAVIKEQQTAGTDGGSSIANARVTRVLNTLTGDLGIASLNSNQVSLMPGEYNIKARAPSYGADGIKLILRNITDTSDAIIGGTGRSVNDAVNQTAMSFLSGPLIIDKLTVFELQHYTSTVKSSNGLGLSVVLAGVVEIYSVLDIIKVN